MKSSVFLKTLFCFLVFVYVSQFLYSQTYEFNDNGERLIVELTDKNPDYYPLVNLSHGLAFAGTPHMPINLTANYNAYIKIFNYGSLNFNRIHLMKIWEEYFLKDWVVGYQNRSEPFTFSNIDIQGNIRIIKKYINTEIPVFYKQEAYSYYKNITLLEIPSEYLTYVDLSIGYLYYKDIFSEGFSDQDESLIVSSEFGTVFDDLFVNLENRSLQIGCVYGKEYFTKAKMDKRNLRKITSKKFYLNILFSLGTEIEDILDQNGDYHKINLNNSALDISNFGFKLGYVKNETIITDYIGWKLGFEIAHYPGVKGYPGSLKNVFASLYTCYSLHFIKYKEGKVIF